MGAGCAKGRDITRILSDKRMSIDIRLTMYKAVIGLVLYYESDTLHAAKTTEPDLLERRENRLLI